MVIQLTSTAKFDDAAARGNVNALAGRLSHDHAPVVAASTRFGGAEVAVAVAVAIAVAIADDLAALGVTRSQLQLPSPSPTISPLRACR